jgi:cytochrome P450
MSSNTNRSGLPPGPRGLPFVGSLWSFYRDPTGFLVRLARDYGDIASFRLGRQRAYQLNHPDLIREVLVNQSRNFSKTRGLDRARLVVGNGLLTSEGEFHHRQRRLVQPAFQRQRLEAYGAPMAEAALQMAQRWREGESVDMFAEMLRLTLTIVGRTLFTSDRDSDAESIRNAMTTVFEYFDWLMLPGARILQKVPHPARSRFEQARAMLDAAAYEMIAEHRRRGTDQGDIISMLLSARDSETDGSGMTDSQARDEIMTMFLAGHETTATALTWTWYLLAKNPTAESRLHEELDRVLGGRVPGTADLVNLEYTRRVLAESMRLFPPVWTLTRRAIADTIVGGYSIPKGTVVGMSQYVMHRDPRFYKEPDVFDPDRWSRDEAEKRPKYAYFPFGGGPRLCIGEQFFWMEAPLLLATLAQFWVAGLPRNHTLQMQPLITLRPRGGLPMTIARRAANQVNHPRPGQTAACA